MRAAAGGCRVNGSFETLDLTPETPFGIARGQTETVETVVVRLAHDGTVGLGAAAPSDYYGETPATVRNVLPDLLAVAEEAGDPHAHQRIHAAMEDVIEDQAAARAAVDIAIHDLAARDLDVPLYRYLGLDPDRTVPSTYTISLAGPGEMADRAAEAVDAGHGRLKVKLGGDDDAAAIRAVRDAAPEAAISVDANGGWDPHEAVRRCGTCADVGVTFVEQPVPGGDTADLRFVRQRSPLPIAVDESCVDAEDVPAVADATDIVNVKLMKCGGIRPAIAQIHAARAHGLEVMLGCMLESNVSIAPAAHLTPLVDHADLDGSLLLAEDPYDGVTMPDCDLAALDTAGTGARPA